ncbi:baculoviral IAP repeat-containing 1 [Pelobates cultripes]|nr:baculoviral IAP repeat-containing 1 [Pelobates cultripes]
MASSEDLRESEDKKVDVMNIQECNPLEMEKSMSFVNADFHQLAAENNAKYAAIRQQLGNSYNASMRSETRRLKSFHSYIKLSSWCPKLMANAGFYFTGVEHSVQCFCCGLVFCTTSLRIPPYEDHVKHNPTCMFIQGKDVGNIPKYEVRVQQSETDGTNLQPSPQFTTEESRQTTFSGWPFYARTQPAELARAGFFFTGLRDTVQCFSCGGCLGNWEEEDDPWKEHTKWFPECNFLGSKKTQVEIKQYIKSYDGFSGFMGKHFTTVLSEKTLPMETRVVHLNIFEDEDVRLDSFKKWPENAHAMPADLAQAGFYYTGVADAVKCFTCGIGLIGFDPGEDPYTEHLRHSSSCEFLQNLAQSKSREVENEKLKKNLQTQFCVSEIQKTCLNNEIYGTDISSECWVQEAANLKHQLMAFYNSWNFSKLSSFPDSSHLSIDLKSLFADISVVLKDTKNQPVRQLTLPDILSVLSDITMIEGEAGSGKTALLRKIAILWASGTCPILSRFSLVFYISISSTENQQTLSDIIRKQLVGSTTLLNENVLEEIIRHLGNQVLFLVDDYGETELAPEAIEDLMLNNPANRVSVAATTCTGTGRKLRKYARNVIGIQEFPLYSSIYLCRQLFSHDMAFVETFLLELISSKTLQAALKTPLFAFALCVYWVENPNEKVSGDTVICKAYLMHNMLNHPKERDRVKALISSCGQLALNGLIQSCFEFTDGDLCTSGVNSNDALKFGLLSKLTSQRLHPIYKFFHPSFQEFLAGIRINELMESTDSVQVEHATLYLRQINTFIKIAGRYHYFLKYSCMHSPKTTSIIISYLFDLMNNSDAYDCQVDTTNHLQHHPDLANIEEIISLLSSNKQHFLLSFVFYMLLYFSIKVAQESNSMTECAPIILRFLSGQDLSMDLTSPNVELCRFLKQYPEAFSMIRSLTLSVSGTECESDLDFVHNDDFASHWDVQTVDQEYSQAFQLVSEVFQKTTPKNYLLRKNVDLSNLVFNVGTSKSPVLKIEVSGHIIDWGTLLCNLMVFLSLSDRIELYVKCCPGFLASVRMCIEKYVDKFVKCSICKVGLSTEEEKLIIQMSSLETLEVTVSHLPEYLISHLDRFQELKELILTCRLSDEWDVINILPDGFKKLQHIKKIELNNVNLRTHSLQFAKFIEHFSNLSCFVLSCDCCPEFEKLIKTLSQNRQIKKIHLSGLFITNKEILDLAAVLPSLTDLVVLKIEGNRCVDSGGLNALAQALPSLVNLEELYLPSGPAMKESAIVIIRQFKHLPNLKNIYLTNNVLDDSSLMALAHETKEGNLSNLSMLNLSANHDITQAGWRDFFLTIDNLASLTELCIARVYAHQFKTDPSTLIALVQCVSRLHRLNKLIMHGWLLDEKDLEMFNAMKQKHPQSKSFMLLWQWILPFRPIVNE